MNIRILGLATVLALSGACNAFRRGAGTNGSDQPTVVEVDNQGFLDMAVYAVRSGQRLRLGTATGNAKTNFRVPSALINGLTPLRFVADPIGGNRASISEEITVAPGDTVGLLIPPV